jgi:hypothetical protein
MRFSLRYLIVLLARLHTGKSKGNINVKSGGESVGGSHPSTGSGQARSKDAKGGAAPSDEGAVGVNVEVKGDGQACLFHTGEVNAGALVEIPCEADGTRSG